MAMDREDLVATLNDLIETCNDGENGFRTCAENIKSAELKQFFLKAARHCEQSAHELQREVQTLGKSAETSGSLTGSMHRGWVNIRATIMGKDDAAILAECERGEDLAKSSYEDALNKDLPPSIRAIVERQYQGLLQHHDIVRDMEIAAKTAS